MYQILRTYVNRNTKSKSYSVSKSSLQGSAGICGDLQGSAGSRLFLQIIKRILHRLTGICRYLAGICRYLVGILQLYCRNLAGIRAISGIKRDVRQLMRVWIVFLSCYTRIWLKIYILVYDCTYILESFLSQIFLHSTVTHQAP